MPTNQVFKGDLAEVSMAKETGLVGQGTGTWADGITATDGWKTTKVGQPQTHQQSQSGVVCIGFIPMEK